jgi:nicotinate phosphoribosyltransferase
MSLCQIVETPILNCINYPTLIATNAFRMKKLAGNRRLMEFGLRRAQGPDGGMPASRYSYIARFDATSNVLAGFEYGIPIAGTVAHSFITSYYSFSQLESALIKKKESNEQVDLNVYAQQVLKDFSWKTNKSELAAFIAQAQTYPNNFNALVDTYSSLESGVPNFLAVAYGLHQAGYKAVGIRLDSGDLIQLSKSTRNMFIQFGDKYQIDYAAKYGITVSNDINEENLKEFNEAGAEIDSYGIGTHLVTCQKQPAIGGVYKLVEINSKARVKLSNEAGKSTLPSKKDLFRLYDEKGKEIGDLLTAEGETVNESKDLPVYQVFPQTKDIRVSFHKAVPLYQPAWTDSKAVVEDIVTVRNRVLGNMENFNPKFLSVSEKQSYPIYISKSVKEILDKLVKKEGAVSSSNKNSSCFEILFTFFLFLILDYV